MDYVLTEHVKTRMKERNISDSDLDRVLQSPQQVIEQDDGTYAYQSLIVRQKRIVMIRVFVDNRIDPARVISAYITTRPDYWTLDDNAT